MQPLATTCRSALRPRRSFARRVSGGATAAALLVLSGCSGVQSALDPAGRGAERLANLFWWMVAGAAVVWTVVVLLTIYASRAPEGRHGRRSLILIIAGGTAATALVLGVLLAYGLAMLPELVAPAPPGSLSIAVRGEQWWWRVHYFMPDGTPVELANEIHLPVDRPVQFHLQSADVIHSFWVPSLGGKMDMFPGRETQLSLLPTRTGLYRGACAEYCGASHALMNFAVVVESEADFNRWLAHQASPAREPSEPLAQQGKTLFLANGCGGCHSVRGTEARGKVGPDLTHVGSRLRLGAGVLPNEPEAFRRWIAETKHVKPDVVMPSFDMLSRQQLRALAAYLESLE